MLRQIQPSLEHSLYCAVALSFLFLAGAAGAKGFRVLHSFTAYSDGAYPAGSLLKDKSGNFYGTTYEGGDAGHGTVFRLAPDGSESVLHSFAGSDGANPQGGLIIDKSGNLYGTTSGGGDADYGTVFELAPDGNETVLHSFEDGSDGAMPSGGLTTDRRGNLYGTTSGVDDLGSVFKLSPHGTLTTLHRFEGSSDGASPFGGVVFDAQGNLYGTAFDGGADGQGTVFKLATDGTLTVLHTFTGGNDGASPFAGVIMDASGNLFGTTFFGGGADCDGGGCGTIFKIAPDGTETILRTFKSGQQGSGPAAPLLMDGNGNLYGTTSGIVSGYGTVFELTSHGAMTVLHSFTGGSDGSQPYGGLIADRKGNLYGTTEYGGQTGGYGVVFRVR